MEQALTVDNFQIEQLRKALFHHNFRYISKAFNNICQFH